MGRWKLPGRGRVWRSRSGVRVYESASVVSGIHTYKCAVKREEEDQEKRKDRRRQELKSS